jgi:ABC-type branched-subunit amino acid transport system substrate-binding protein
LKLKSITVFYVETSDYSRVLKNDFREKFLAKEGEITDEIDIAPDEPVVPDINIKEEIDTAFEKGNKALLLISNVNTNSVAIAISRKNSERPVEKRMRLISAMSLSEQETIEKGGEAVKGMILVRPCIAQNSKYVQEAIKRWQLKEINWRQSSSYDTTQAFVKAIKQSKSVSRQSIVSELRSKSESGSLSFSLSKGETAGFGLKWDKLDRSNINQQYCVVQIKNGRFVEIDSTTSHLPNK